MQGAETSTRRPAWAWPCGLAALAVVAALPWLLGPFHVRIVQQILLFGGLAIAWSLLGGFTTYWSFGHTAFVGLGAFAAGLIEQQLSPGLPAMLKLVIGLAFAVGLSAAIAVAVAVPVLRLRGIYFAVAMLAVAEILGEASRNFDVFQGAIGFTFPLLRVSGLSTIQVFYYLFFALFIVSGAVFLWLKNSRLGVGLTSIGQDEDTAAMLGVPTERYKLIAFVLSAMLTTAGGVLYGHSLGFITSGSVFRIDISFNLILFCMIGGLGTLLGPMIGAVIMIVLTQVVLGELLDFHMMITGSLLIAIVLLAPKGLIGTAQRFLGRRRPRQMEPAS